MEGYFLENKHVQEWIMGIMKLLNFFIITYFTIVIADCLTGYVQEQGALSFLERISNIPMEPWKIPVVTLGTYLCLLLLLSMEEVVGYGFLLKICAEGIIAFVISKGLHFAYVGVFLLVLADVVRQVSDLKWKIFLVSLVCGIYLLLDYNFLSVWFRIVSFEECLRYYAVNVSSLFLGIRNVCICLNLFVFIIYMVMEILAQSSEKERILRLNLELNKVNEELKDANCKLEEYAKESVRAAEMKERNRLAREIHDTLGHSLTGIITGIEACVMIMDLAPEATKEQLKAIADVARNGIIDVRRSVNALRPDALENLALDQALEQMVDEVRRSTGVTIRYSCEAQINGCSQDESDVIYRIVQESMTNAIRHGKATEIDIRISRQFQLLHIHIKDNGIGCASVKKGFGLHHMKERLDILAGTLVYDGSDGFVIDAKIPIRWGKEGEND